MKRDEIITIICRNYDALEKMRLAQACLFGSVARDEADSNVGVNLK